RAVHDCLAVRREARGADVAAAEAELAEGELRTLPEVPAKPEGPAGNYDEGESQYTGQKPRPTARCFRGQLGVGAGFGEGISQAPQLSGEICGGGVASPLLLGETPLHDPAKGRRNLRVQGRDRFGFVLNDRR